MSYADDMGNSRELAINGQNLSVTDGKQVKADSGNKMNTAVHTTWSYW